MNVEILALMILALEGGPFRGRLNAGGGTLVNGIRAPSKVLRACSPPWRREDTAEDAVHEPGGGTSPDTQSAGPLTLNVQPLELWEINVRCLSPPAYDVFVTEPEQSKTEV